jgi:hypothetical protein
MLRTGTGRQIAARGGLDSSNLLREKNMAWKEILEEFMGRIEKGCFDHYYPLSKRLFDDPRTENIVRLYKRYALTHPQILTNPHTMG